MDHTLHHYNQTPKKFIIKIIISGNRTAAELIRCMRGGQCEKVFTDDDDGGGGGDGDVGGGGNKIIIKITKSTDALLVIQGADGCQWNSSGLRLSQRWRRGLLEGSRLDPSNNLVQNM